VLDAPNILREAIMSIDDAKFNREPGGLGTMEQLRVFAIEVFLVALLVVAFGFMTFPQFLGGDTYKGGIISQDDWSGLLCLAALGGIFGGAARSLINLMEEIGSSARAPKMTVHDHLERWFLYIGKPFLGAASGTLFLLAVNVGLVQPLIGSGDNNHRDFSVLTVLFIAAIGGFCYEETYHTLKNLMGALKGGG